MTLRFSSTPRQKCFSWKSVQVTRLPFNFSWKKGCFSCKLQPVAFPYSGVCERPKLHKWAEESSPVALRTCKPSRQDGGASRASPFPKPTHFCWVMAERAFHWLTKINVLALKKQPHTSLDSHTKSTEMKFSLSVCEIAVR